MLEPIVCHMLLNTPVEPVKWTPARSGWASTTSDTMPGVAGDEVDDPRRQARRFQQPLHVVRARDGAGGRLPQHHVAHQGGGGGEVAADGGEVEGCHRVDEAFERSVVHLVPHAVVGDRLLLVQLLRVEGVVAPEVDQLTGGIDLGLERGLGLAQHGGRVQGGPPGGGEQLRRAQEHGGAVLPGPARPLPLRGLRGLDRQHHLLRARLVPVGQDVAVIVGHHGRGLVAGADVFASDDQGHVQALARHAREPGLQLGALGAAGSVGPDWLVRRRRDAAYAVEAGHGCFSLFFENSGILARPPVPRRLRPGPSSRASRRGRGKTVETRSGTSWSTPGATRPSLPGLYERTARPVVAPRGSAGPGLRSG